MTKSTDNKIVTMTSGQKIAFSLLISMLIFAGFVVGANYKLFSELETRFYAQTKIAEKTQELDKTAESFNSYITNILTLTGDYAKNASVSTYLEQNPSEYDVSQRRTLTEELFKQLPGLNGIRLVDKNGRNVHYSSFDSTDILKQSGVTKIYKNYQDIQKDSDELDFSLLQTEQSGQIYIDSKNSRLIVSQPFYWMDNLYSGNLLCYFNFYDLKNELAEKGTFAYGENFGIFANEKLKGGIVLGIPKGAYKELESPVLENWANQEEQKQSASVPEKILYSTDETYWTLLSASENCGIKISGLYKSSNFELTSDIIWMIYICVFITVFLIVYLIFSLRQDSFSVTRKRIRKLQQGIIQEYISRKEDVNWEKVAAELNSKKANLLENLKSDVKKHSKNQKEKVNALLEESFKEILSIINKPEAKTETGNSTSSEVAEASQNSGISLEQLKAMLEEVISKSNFTVKTVVQKQKNAVPKPVASHPADDVAELDEVEDVEDVAELDEVDGVEPIEELEEESAAEEDVAELDEVDDVEPVEELEEEPAAEEDVAELDEVEDIEEVAELDEVDDVEPVEELEEESAAEDEVAELDEVEDVEDVAELDEVDDVEPVEELEEEPAAEEEVAELDEVEDVEDVAELDEVDDVEPVEELDEFVEDGDEKEIPIESKKDAFYSVDNIFPARDEYFEDSDSFIRSEKFATVDDLFAEELSLGKEYTSTGKKSETVIDFKIFSPFGDDETETESSVSTVQTDVLAAEQPEVQTSEKVIASEQSESEEQPMEEIEELTEEAPAPEEKEYYSMTGFGQNEEIQSLEEINDIIQEKDGVFQIAQAEPFNNPNYNQDFKKLVDKVLRQ